MYKKMNSINDLHALAQLTNGFRKSNKTIGLVPTMGALHEGHLSLVDQALQETDETIVTIFVNPSQFAAGEDLDQYPRTLEADLEKLAEVGAQHVFVPTADLVYPPGFSTSITPPQVAARLEGEFRPTHFSGVATVVLKLFNMTRADVAFFGQKDYQQVCVLRAMTADLNVNVQMRVCPIVREADGLALSSRNRYLDADQRKTALVLYQTLQHTRDLITGGLNDGFEIVTEMRQMLIDGGVDNIDYAVVANPQTLETADFIDGPVVALVAAHVGKTRLIDNLMIQ